MAVDNEKNKKGFAGLIDLASDVSEVDEIVESGPASESKPSKATYVSPSTSKTTSRSKPEHKSTPSHSSVETVDSGNSAGGFALKLIFRIVAGVLLICLVNVAVVILIWLVNQVWQSPKKASYNPSQPTYTYNLRQSNPTSAKTSNTSRSLEQLYEKPPVGTNHVHSVSQIRWCVRESIRIDTMRDLIDSNEGVDKFNKIVADYNRRCGSYRYRIGTLDRARREVEANRSQIVAKAIRDAKTLGYSHQLIREVQKLLTELGYEPGPIDGQYGRRTAAAIKAFQKYAGLTQDGLIDEDLLNSLKMEREVWYIVR
ncbi:MAG: hypothetical protein B5M56_05565 [Desulfococcus sp. 4484_241]|nr:MAG: hypothetical protein B5M56_05565 [Desulfococcus sp. 4484_241]